MIENFSARRGRASFSSLIKIHLEEGSTSRDVGSISNLGHDAWRALFPLEKGAFSKNKKGTSLFIAISWPPMPPVPTSMSTSFNYCSVDIRA